MEATEWACAVLFAALHFLVFTAAEVDDVTSHVVMKRFPNKESANTLSKKHSNIALAESMALSPQIDIAIETDDGNRQPAEIDEIEDIQLANQTLPDIKKPAADVSKPKGKHARMSGLIFC